MALSEQVRDVLLGEIISGRFPVGSKLSSVHEYARDFQVSTSPVRVAFAELEARGYVVSRYGSGTYVRANHPPLTVKDSVMICIEAKAHLFGDLGSALTVRLLKQGFLPGVVDTGFVESQAGLLDRALASDARFFVVHGNLSFDFGVLQRAALPGRHVIGVIDWETELPISNVHRVLSDHLEGGRLMARHLYERGHRNVLMLGTDTMFSRVSGELLHPVRQGWGFAETWNESGGSWQSLCSDALPDLEITLNSERLLRCFKGSNAPTAIFGLRDVEAWHAQTILLSHAPELAASVEVVGYGNTPWSQAGHPPFTTVDLDLNRIGDEVVQLIGKLRKDELTASVDPVKIQPRLVVRGESGRCSRA